MINVSKYKLAILGIKYIPFYSLNYYDRLF